MEYMVGVSIELDTVNSYYNGIVLKSIGLVTNFSRKETDFQINIFTSTVESRYLKFDGTIFYKSKLPVVQINLPFW